MAKEKEESCVRLVTVAEFAQDAGVHLRTLRDRMSYHASKRPEPVDFRGRSALYEYADLKKFWSECGEMNPSTKARSVVERSQEAVDHRRGVLEKAEASLASAKERVKKTQAEVVRREGSVVRHTGELAKTRERLPDAEKSIARRKESLAKATDVGRPRLEGLLEKAEETLQRRHGAIQRSQEELETAKQHLATGRAVLAERQGRVAELKKEVTAQRKQLREAEELLRLHQSVHVS